VHSSPRTLGSSTIVCAYRAAGHELHDEGREVVERDEVVRSGAAAGVEVG
jgi:hypothetical protein